MPSLRLIAVLFACYCGIAAAQESERSFVIPNDRAQVSFAPQNQLQSVADGFGAQAPPQYRPTPIQQASHSDYRPSVELDREPEIVPVSVGRTDTTNIQTAVLFPTQTVPRPILEHSPLESESDENEEAAPQKQSLLDVPLVHRSSPDGKGKIDKPFVSGGIGPVVSMFISLFLVITTFLIFALLFKKVSPKNGKLLPRELFENLGRTSLTPKIQLHLLRLGNRLILVSATLDGVQPITEITDPDEVVQLLGLCRQLDSNSSTQNFKKMFNSLAAEPTEGGYFGTDADLRSKPKSKAVPRTKSTLVDLYSDPDESLTTLLANGLKGGRHG